MKTFWYFPLESLNARYTTQLCTQWMPAAFNAAQTTDWKMEVISAPAVSQEIKTGSVLDAVNRGVVSLSQMQELLQRLDEVKSGDVIFLQDLWTPGLEAVLYALHQQSKHVRIYAMCHAQSVDEYDFTYPMRAWMRPIEQGWSHAFAGIFVGSTIHRDQMRAAGYVCPIHVVGLPIDAIAVRREMPYTAREKQVIFSSRLNNEKNPYFMLEVAARFLRSNPGWRWVVTTSAAEWSSEVAGVVRAGFRMMVDEPRFTMLKGLTKQGYYAELRRSAIQFNSSLQDYVSWCLLEATLAGCDVCYPNFRSFPECVDASRLYQPFDVGSACAGLEHAATFPLVHDRPAEVCDRGRNVEMNIMLRDWKGPEVNVWHQPQRYFLNVGLL